MRPGIGIDANSLMCEGSNWLFSTQERLNYLLTHSIVIILVFLQCLGGSFVVYR